MADSTIDKALVTNLKLARKRDAKKPCFFALVVKSVSEGKLIVDKKKIPPKLVAESKKDIGATMIVKGLCFGEDGGLVFETVKPPAPNWTALTKRLAKVNAGLTLPVLYRQGRDDEVVEESAAEGDDAPDAPAGDDGGAMAAREAAEAAWKQRLDAVTARVKAAAAAGNPAARDMALGVSQAGALFRGGDAAGASSRLGEVETLLGGAAAKPTPPSDASQRFKNLTDSIKAALAEKGPNLARIQTLAAAAAGLLKNNDAAQATKVLDELEPLLKSGTTPGGTDPAAEWKDALTAAQPVVKAALAAKGPNAAEITKLFTQANALSKPGGDMAQALAKLKECVALASPQGETVPKAPPTPPTDPAAAWKQALAEAQPAIKAALAAKGPNVAEITKLFAQANALSKPGGDMAQAQAKLKECVALSTAGQTPPGSPSQEQEQPAPQEQPGHNAPTPAAIAAWQAAREKVVKQIRVAAAKIEATKEPSAIPAVIELKSIIAQLTVSPATPQQVSELDRYVRTDDVISDAETLPPDFGTLAIRQPLLDAIAQLKS